MSKKAKIISKNIDTDKIYYHDGQLLHYEESYSTQERTKREIVITVALFPSHQASSRDTYTFTFTGVKRAVKVHNYFDHEFDISAGNISNGYILDDGTTFIYICGGMIEILAEEIIIARL